MGSAYQHEEVLNKLNRMVTGLYFKDWSDIRQLICHQVQITYVVNDHESKVVRDADRQIQAWQEMLSKVTWKLERQGRVNIRSMEDRIYISYAVKSEFIDIDAGHCVWREQGEHEIFMIEESGEWRFKSIRIKINTTEGGLCILRDHSRANELAKSSDLPMKDDSIQK